MPNLYFLSVFLIITNAWGDESAEKCPAERQITKWNFISSKSESVCMSIENFEAAEKMRNEYRITLQKEQEERRQRQELLEPQRLESQRQFQQQQQYQQQQQQYQQQQQQYQQQQQQKEYDKTMTDSRLQKKYNMNDNSERTEYHREVNRLDRQRESQYQYRQY